MAYTICKKHGGSFMSAVCPHVAQGVETGTPIAMTFAEVDDFWYRSTALCRDCLQKWNQILDESGKEAFAETIIPICSKCFHEYEAGDLTHQQ